MAISNLPTSKEIESPHLQVLSDGKEHRWRDIVNALAEHFVLTDTGLEERLPSGQKRFYHQCAFARLDLKSQAFVESSRREYWKITAHGDDRSVLTLSKMLFF